ncbi:FAD-binding domain-containing protein [Xylariaceae sp. FL0255]|nr:FAD-binding domain-containing protein [Xylariaceae sp. FL0255]
MPAGCIINPNSTEQVAMAIQILNRFQTKFAVRSGGHNYNPGFAGIGGSGVLISLSELNTIQPSQDLSSVTVGPGNKWEDVYGALVPLGVEVVGGRVGPVGVGGLILSGGLSYLPSRNGLALDNVKSFEVVLANGSIVTANATNAQADLYKALRGGGSNFGIVTNYELYTQPTGTYQFDPRAYAPNLTTAFFDAFTEYQAQGQLDTNSNIVVQVLETGPTLLMLYNGTETNTTAFAPFLALEPYTAIVPPSSGSLLDVLALSNSRFPTGDIRVQGETWSHLTDASLLNDLYEIWVNATTSLPANSTAVWVPNPISGNVATVGQQYGGNLLSLTAQAQVWYESYILYSDAADDATVQQITEQVTAQCIAAAQAKGLYLPFLFANTAGADQQVLQSYGSDSVSYMKTVAAKYDPSGVFQQLQNDGFLLRDT